MHTYEQLFEGSDLLLSKCIEKQLAHLTSVEENFLWREGAMCRGMVFCFFHALHKNFLCYRLLKSNQASLWTLILDTDVLINHYLQIPKR